MLPYIVAAGHHKYAVYLPLYINEMKMLEQTAPPVHKQYKEHGDFTIYRRMADTMVSLQTW